MDTKTRFQLKLVLLLLLVALIAVPATVSAYRKAPTYDITVTTTKKLFGPSLQDATLTAPLEKGSLVSPGDSDGGARGGEGSDIGGPSDKGGETDNILGPSQSQETSETPTP